MKVLRVLTIICFALVILIPTLIFNLEEDAISVIDNRKLAVNPFSAEAAGNGDLTESIENYVGDRIGLRDEMILAYTVLNDKIFGKMIHPSYVYGKDEYVFSGGLTVYPCYGEFHETFADMVLKIQDYCRERDIPFVFVFNPAKPAILTEYIPQGMNYDREWVDLFLRALDKRGINYIDNTEILREKTAEGEKVFNKKYDANHWNDLGALYGTNQILQVIKKDIPEVHVNEEEELTFGEMRQTTLPVSEFPIDEMVPNIEINMSYESIAEEYREELALNPNFQGFNYCINSERIEEGSPRALVFQGSYMNGFGSKYLINGFGEYIAVHDYQNVIDFPYYFNIFKPDCVVFEVAEYTFSNGYFDLERMKAMDLNPTLDNVLSKNDNIQDKKLDKDKLTVEKGKKLTKINWRTDEDISRGWLKLDEENVYDLKKNESEYETTVLTEEYEEYMKDMQIISIGKDGEIYRYLVSEDRL